MRAYPLVWFRRLGRAAFAFAAVLASVASHARDVTPAQTFSGTMPLSVPPLLVSPITSRADLERAWSMCSVKAPLPSIDFKKRMVLAVANQSSTLSFMRITVDDGNLKTNVAVSPDMPGLRTCAFAVVDRAGVKTVNGAALRK